MKINKLLVMTLGLWAGATFAADLKIATVDIQRVMQEAPQVQALRQSMEKDFGARQKQLTSDQDAFVKKQESYERDKAVMSADKRKQQEQDLINQRQSLLRKQQDFQNDLQKGQTEGLQRIEKLVRQAVEEIAKREGYDLVLLQGVGVAYAKPNMDVTDKVMEQIKKSKL